MLAFINLKKVFGLFNDRIKNRFDLKGDNFSEDYMRYVLFTSLLMNTTEGKKDSLLPHIDLECPYENLVSNKELQKKRLDMWASFGKPQIAIECKYHRKGKRSMACTQNTGSILEDWRRLSEIKGSHEHVNCYFVYATTQKMVDHLHANYKNLHEILFLSKQGKPMPITKKFTKSIKSKRPTLDKEIKKAFKCTITNVWADECIKHESKIYIRIFKVDI